MLDQAGHIEFGDDVGSGVFCRNVCDGHDIDHEKDDVGDVEVPNPLGEPGCPDNEAALQHHSPVENRRSIAGDEDENIRGAAQSEVSNRDQAHDIVGNMIHKDEPVRQPSKQVEPVVASVCRENSFDVHEGGFRARDFGARRSINDSAHRNRSAGAPATPIDFT